MRYADEDRAGGRNTMTRHADIDLCTPGIDELDLAEALELLDDKPREIPEQHGPVRWIDKELRCARRGCSSPTFLKIKGIPRCHKHAIEELNEMLSND